MKIKRIHIYDLDGTIITSSHRYRTIIDANGEERIDLDHWRAHETEKHIMRDGLLPHAAQYKADLTNPEIYVIVATARACVKGDANYKFLKRKLGLPNKFIHRAGPNDMRGGAELKIQGIKPLLNLKQFRDATVHVWEDNKDYLSKMCKALGAVPHFVPSTQGY